MRLLYLSFCTLLLAFGFLPLRAAIPFSKSFNIKNGLPSTEVYDVGFDRNGIPWFCSDRGISGYNGYELTTLTSEDGLSNNTALDVFQAKNGELWFCGLDGTLSRWDGNTLEPFDGNEEIKRLIDPNMLVEGMAEANDGRIYLIYWVTRTALLGSINPVSGEFRLENLDSLKAKFGVIRVRENEWLDIDGQLLALGLSKACTLTEDGRLFFLPNNKIGRLAVAQMDSQKEVLRINLTTQIYHLYWDDAHGLWAGTAKGLYLFLGGDLGKKPLHFFKGTAISRIRKDKEQSFWVTSLEKGAFMVPSFDFTLLPFPGSSKSNSLVTSLFSTDSLLVCSSLKGQLMVVNKDLTTHLIHDDPLLSGGLRSAFSFGDSLVVGMLKLWWKEGALQIDVIESYNYHSFGYPLDNGDLFWAGNQGIVVLRNGETVFSNPDWALRIHSCTQKGNRIFLGCMDGLWTIENYGYNEVKRFMPEEKLLQTRINHLERDSHGNLWASTLGHGLLYIDSGGVRQVSNSQGLVSSQVNATFCDGNHLWAATNKGLSRLVYTWNGELKVGEVDNLTTADGFPANSLQGVRVWNDRVWLATGEGLVSFDPDLLEKRLVHPVPVLLEGVMVNQKPHGTAGNVNLEHWQNDFDFRFLGISLRPSIEALRYRYRLQPMGETEPWAYTRDRSVRYLNLAPGRYIFEVAAENRKGVWSEQAATFDFVIRPHYSQTGWFQGALLLLAGMTLAGGFWWRSHRATQKAKEARKLQAAEIAALRSQMNPHFVFNALNAIQNFIFRKDVRNANYYLSRFSRLMREGLLFSRQPTVLLRQELEFLEAYLELEKMRFPERFDYRVRVDAELDPEKVQIPPFLCQPLLENAIKHGFKDTGHKGSLLLEFKWLNPQTMAILIEDNGSGFFPSSDGGKVYHESLGLQIVRDRIALLSPSGKAAQATFEVGNRPAARGTGTLARITLTIQ